MKKYADMLKKHKIKYIYKDYDEINKSFYSSINKDTTVYLNPIDHKLEAKYKKVLS